MRGDIQGETYKHTHTARLSADPVASTVHHTAPAYAASCPQHSTACKQSRTALASQPPVGVCQTPTPCSPPHSSMDTPGTSTTRTTSSYFSPNMAVAPAARAASSSISAVAVGEAAATQLLTRRSTSDTSAGATGRLRLKSNLRNTCRGKGEGWGRDRGCLQHNSAADKSPPHHPAARRAHRRGRQHDSAGSVCAAGASSHLSLLASTRLPCWQVSGPSTCLSALCSRCVAVWWALMRRR